jgi:hypothetical protein
MSFETEPRSWTTVGQACNGAGAECSDEESVRTPGGSTTLQPEPGLQQPHLQGETVVIERTRGSGTGNRSRSEDLSPEVPLLLLDRSVAQDFRSRWNEIQVAFVDEPRDAVGRADRLVAETINGLTESFTAERQKLEREWDRGSTDSTEALRLAFQGYRSFFNRLLSV